MFSKKDDDVEVASAITGFIGKGMSFEGKVEFKGTMRLDGNFKGEIKSDGTLLVGEGAAFDGNLSVDNTIISGEIKGIVVARSKVELRAPAKVYGDIKTPTLVIGEGVVFDGNCVMTKKQDASHIKPVESPVESIEPQLSNAEKTVG